jgi:predicted nucleic acid-binding protein
VKLHDTGAAGRCNPASAVSAVNHASRAGLDKESVLLKAAVTRPRTEFGGRPLVPPERATLEAESYMAEFPVVYPTAEVLRAALHGLSAYRLSWFDAHLWAHAEVHGIPEILSEDFEHGRHYGRVRVADPFLMAADRVNQLPSLYAT